jgi:transposase
MHHFRAIERDIDFLLPPSVQEWLPEAHLARYVVEVIDALELREMERAYAGRGSAAYHPAMLLALLVYGYATGGFSSRKIERATYDSLAFRFIAANSHPDQDTLARFRRRFAKEIEASFVEVLQVARENRLARFGTLSLDGTKIHASASRHSALSYGHAEAIEAQLKAEVQELLALAEQADYHAKLAARAAKAPRGRKPGGKPPKPPTPGPRPEEQINLTDEQSRIMPVAGGGFEQCYNAQAVVDAESMPVVVAQVVQATNDNQQVVPILKRLPEQPEDLPNPQVLLADSGFFREANVAACEAAGIEPLIALARDEHPPHWSERFAEPAPPPPQATALQRMAQRLKTHAGRASYALRKQSVEPVFAIIKSVMGFRQFLTRGLTNVHNEWTLVCLAWNLKRMAVLRL